MLGGLEKEAREAMKGCGLIISQCRHGSGGSGASERRVVGLSLTGE